MTDEELIKEFMRKNCVTKCPTRYSSSVLGAEDLSGVKTAEPKRRKKAWNMCSKPEKLDIERHNQSRQEARDIINARNERNSNANNVKTKPKHKNKAIRKPKSRKEYLDIVVKRNAKIMADYVSGMLQSEICTKYHVSPRTVQRATAGSGVSREIPRSSGPRKATALDMSIASMVKDGWTIAQAARAHEIGYEQARYGLRRAGGKSPIRGGQGNHRGETPPDMTGKFLADNA